MDPLNGKLSPLPDPSPIIAEVVYTAMMDEGDAAFRDLNPEDRESFQAITQQYLTAHLNYLTAHGYRVMPPGIIPLPKSVEEALAMIQAAQTWLDANKRKTNLIGFGKKKIVLPQDLN